VLRAFGPPSVLRLEEVQEPQPGPGQVLLGVHLANVTFVETQIRAGKARAHGLTEEGAGF